MLRMFENRVLRETWVGEDGSSLFVLLIEYYWDDKQRVRACSTHAADEKSRKSLVDKPEESH